ncbi:MAG: endonuclease/exonuclease/phosphatase family protein [Bacteroidaceae bacterium]|nr:endonuclease/exonuclease/phosphatase family protein [Bacteroidaceae bacterium]
MRKLFLALSLLTMVTAVLTGCKSESSTKFVLATYNIRYEGQGDYDNGNGWSTRRDYIAQLIRFHGFDIFGTQEGLYNQLQDLKDRLPGFDYIGVGRNDGKQDGEFAAIFYRTDMFEVLDHGDFWLSTDTEKPNVGWDAALPRVCTWGKFRVKDSGFTFIYYNLHMDHIGVVARAESAKLILKRVTENPEKLPAILSGDFNINQHNESFALIDNSGIMSDAYRIADLKYINNGTYNAFSPASPTPDERIDHIFLTEDFHIYKYGVLTDVYYSETTDAEGNKTKVARTPSDHFPVMVTVEVKK